MTNRDDSPGTVASSTVVTDLPPMCPPCVLTPGLQCPGLHDPASSARPESPRLAHYPDQSETGLRYQRSLVSWPIVTLIMTPETLSSWRPCMISPPCRPPSAWWPHPAPGTGGDSRPPGQRKVTIILEQYQEYVPCFDCPLFFVVILYCLHLSEFSCSWMKPNISIQENKLFV